MSKSLRVLVVEDDETDALLILREIRKCGFDPVSERVYDRASMIAALDRQGWDIVLADQSLPQFSAVEALQIVKARGLDAPFVIVSGMIGFETALEAMRSGADDYVMKGNLERLVPVVERALREAETRAGRRKAELARRESEAKFSVLAENIPAIIFVHQEARFCYVNPAAERILGYSREELLQMNFWQVIRPDFREEIRVQGLRRQQGEALPARSQFPIISKSGEERWLECTAGLTEFSGRPAVIGSAFDVSDRKQAEKRSEGFSRLGHRLGAAATAREAAQIIVAIADELLGWDACYLHLYSQSGAIIPVLTLDTIEGQKNEVAPSFSLEPSPLMREVSTRGARLVNRTEGADTPAGLIRFGDTSRASASMIYVPVRSHTKVIGILSIQSYTPVAYDQQALNTLQALADHCGGALERIQVGMTLRQSEERFRQVVENIGEVFWMTDLTKQSMIYISPAYESVWGRSCQSLYASPTDWLEAIHPEDRPRVLQAVMTKQISGDYQEEYRVQRPDGTVRWIFDRAFPIKDTAGKVYRIAGVAQDITELKLGEEVLRHSEAQFRALFESAPIAMAIHGSNGRFVQTNRAYQDMLGYSNEELLRIGIKGITHPDDIAEGKYFYNEMVEGKRSISRREKRYVRRDGQIVWAQSTASVVRSPSGEVRHIISMVEDITERKKLSREILRVSEREQQRFGQDVHDGLCQNLVAVKFKAMLLEKKLAAHASSEVAQAQTITKLLNHAIQEAYDLAKGLHPVKIEAEGLRCALEELAVQTESRFDVQCRFRLRNDVLIADNTVGIHMYRIAQEAVTNAIKHGKATRIWISLIAINGGIPLACDGKGCTDAESAAVLDQPSTSRPSRSSARHVILTVKDNGIGFAVHSAKKGGMGLHIMNYRAGVIGASFHLRWRIHGGTRVTCVLPVQTSEKLNGSSGSALEAKAERHQLSTA